MLKDNNSVGDVADNQFFNAYVIPVGSVDDIAKAVETGVPLEGDAVHTVMRQVRYDGSGIDDPFTSTLVIPVGNIPPGTTHLILTTGEID